MLIDKCSFKVKEGSGDMYYTLELSGLSEPDRAVRVHPAAECATTARTTPGRGAVSL
ncbi:MAG: hypothetical protein ACLRZZ_28495 [Enterocloster sp.]